MELSQILTNDKIQTRRNTIALARSKNYKVSELYAQVSDLFFSIMDDIHNNEKEGDYDLACQISVVKRTLSTWI